MAGRVGSVAGSMRPGRGRRSRQPALRGGAGQARARSWNESAPAPGARSTDFAGSGLLSPGPALRGEAAEILDGITRFRPPRSSTPETGPAVPLDPDPGDPPRFPGGLRMTRPRGPR